VDNFTKIKNLVMGYKTYAFIGLALIVSILEQQDVISPMAASTSMDYIMAGGGVSMVAKLNRWITPGS
jgi:hypothetical protein